NLFDKPDVLVRMLSWYSGQLHVATKILHASFSYLNRRNFRSHVPKRLAIFGCKWEVQLSFLSGICRFLDRRFETRFSIYGWAVYFGNIPEAVLTQPWTNVCIRCGQGHASDWLAHIGAVQARRSYLPSYICPVCGANNLYTSDYPTT